jgi:uncharacterized membrane protein YhaH (DUF805 family)
MKFYILGFQNYFNFSGRSTKEEFWYFFLIQILLSIVVVFLSVYPLTIAFFLVSIIPSLSVQFRRLNDIGKRRFWATLPLSLMAIDIVLYFSLLGYHSMMKNVVFIILGLMKVVTIVLLLIWYLRDSKELPS